MIMPAIILQDELIQWVLRTLSYSKRAVALVREATQLLACLMQMAKPLPGTAFILARGVAAAEVAAAEVAAAEVGTAAPWYGKPGGGIQIRFPSAIKNHASGPY